MVANSKPTVSTASAYHARRGEGQPSSARSAGAIPLDVDSRNLRLTSTKRKARLVAGRALCLLADQGALGAPDPARIT
jgi:hypothetical protein